MTTTWESVLLVPLEGISARL